MANITAIVQARMGSNRLPGKVAREIAGKPLLAHIIERLEYAETVDEIVIATSSKKADERVVEIAEEYGAKYYRGSEENVFSRYIEAGEENNSEIIIRITGDCPLIDPVTVDKVVEDFLNSDYEYMRLDVGDNGYPRGLDAEVFYYETLLKAGKYIKEEGNQGVSIESYLEHVTLYIYHHQEKFSLGYHYPPVELKRNYRLCVDEQADFELIKIIYDRFYKNGGIVDIREVVRFMDGSREIASINQGVKQKKTQGV